MSSLDILLLYICLPNMVCWCSGVESISAVEASSRQQPGPAAAASPQSPDTLVTHRDLSIDTQRYSVTCHTDMSRRLTTCLGCAIDS